MDVGVATLSVNRPRSWGMQPPASALHRITVLDVSRDKIQVLDDQGQTAWIDVIRGASAGDPAFQWLDMRF
ncbi:MAG: hypothetical protein E2P06_13765 [Acidobacteria bacterium]|nr:MAG: hypothetical protein E2P06_13765 [Acidobacteriota bacterium]